jgi:TatD DNase family protein
VYREDSVVVASLSVEELLTEATPANYTTAGIHPWWMEDYTQEEIEKFKIQVESRAKKGDLWAIGETGLDRLYPETLNEQKELFLWHLNLANKYQLPLIIHNVRSGSDFLQMIKEHKPKTPWIFHDFRGNETLMHDLLRLHPDCYFSFGISIDNSKEIRELLPLVPAQNLFLETDDQKHLDIHDVHLRAAHHLDMDLAFLKAQVWHNFKKLTNKTLH